MGIGNRLAAYIDFLFPREVLGSVVLVFSLENITQAAFDMHLPGNQHLLGWIVLFLGFTIIFAVWGESEDEMPHEEVDSIHDVFDD